MNHNDLIKKRLIELHDRAYTHGYTVYSDFLNIQEQSILKSLGLHCVTYGGFDMAERVVAGFGDSLTVEDFPIVCLCISPLMQKFSDCLSHRDFLGAVMNLGIKRELIGDILVRENKGYLFCLDKISSYIADNLTNIRHTPVNVTLAKHLPESAYKAPPVTELMVSSLRCDVVLCGVYKLSRSNASKLFNADKVFINSRLINSTSQSLKPGDMVSVRGYGRFLFEGEVRTTRKGNPVIAVKIYK